ncbi:MAG: discoidin domain-containing protein, partial [Bacteroidales bacterium]|nr:discoidin domain-containing protein [Bacteroidales bacterium]
RKTYYDWENTYAIVRELQPDAVIFSDAGPDVRWVGNEQGWANPANWCSLRRKEIYPGYGRYKELRSGHEDGTNWVPAECDVSIRPGWYYHPVQDNKVKSLTHLLNIYYRSIGRNASFLLNFPVDSRGLIHENDVKQVLKLAETIRKDFAKDLARGKKVQASQIRGNSRKFSPRNVNDGIKDTYWTTDDQITTAYLVIDLGKPTSINRFLVQEYIPLGQRVQQFTIEAFLKNSWQEIASETTIGYKRILRFTTVETDKIRFKITQSKACPVISNIELYNAPVVIQEVEILDDSWQVVFVKKIWDQANHSAFTDLIRFTDNWYCTFREGESHAGGDKGKIRVIRSADGQEWSSVAYFVADDPNDSVILDLRDPKLAITDDDRLMMHAGASLYEGSKRVGFSPMVSFSKDGSIWSGLEPIDITDSWPWRPIWHKGQAYVVAYNPDLKTLILYVSTDGIHYKPLNEISIPDGFPNETTLRFLENEDIIALVRREQDDKKAMIGISKPPYENWSFKKTARRIGGPNFIVLEDGRFIAAGRMYFDDQPKTTLATIDLDGNIEPKIILPSGGDNSYPGMVHYEGYLWLSYYSSHEGKTTIYLAKIKL